MPDVNAMRRVLLVRTRADHKCERCGGGHSQGKELMIHYITKHKNVDCMVLLCKTCLATVMWYRVKLSVALRKGKGGIIE